MSRDQQRGPQPRAMPKRTASGADCKGADCGNCGFVLFVLIFVGFISYLISVCFGVCKGTADPVIRLQCDQFQGEGSTSSRATGEDGKVWPSIGDLISECTDARIIINSTNNTVTAPWESSWESSWDSWTAPWYSREALTTCAQYGHHQLCNPCTALIVDGSLADFPDARVGGAGWKNEWGTPGDEQYKNHGHTAASACCACGGGVQTPGAEPTTTIELCTEWALACDELDSHTASCSTMFMATAVAACACCCCCCFLPAVWEGSHISCVTEPVKACALDCTTEPVKACCCACLNRFRLRHEEEQQHEDRVASC
eukprot:COSAG02_NODE_2176_length_9589_cov_4.787671_3_plen_314_part_00